MQSMKTKYVFLFLLSIVLVVSLAACGGGAPATTAPATGGDSGAPASGDIVAKFDFTNQGTVDICSLFLSPASKEEWGPDQLAGQKIAAGAKFTLTNIPAATYDAKWVACDGTEGTLQLDIKN